MRGDGVPSAAGVVGHWEEKPTMLTAVDGFWIRAVAFNEGSFRNSSFHFFETPGLNVYATITLSGVSRASSGSEHGLAAVASIIRWTTWGPDGKLVAPSPGSMGETQNAVVVRNCASLEFALDVRNAVDAIAQINIFRF
jgi:hypothetical protein